jgi:hypothetical protein
MSTLEFPAKNVYIRDLAIMDGWSMIDIASGDHYVGSASTRANYEWCVENWSQNQDVKFIYGTNESYGIAYRILTEDEEIHEAIHAMSEHGVICDETLRAVESRWIQEAKDSWAIFDFTREVEFLFGEDILTEISEETIDRLFNACVLLSEEQWSFEFASAEIDVRGFACYLEVAIANL